MSAALPFCRLARRLEHRLGELGRPRESELTSASTSSAR